MTAQPVDAPRGWYPKAERDKLLARIDDLEAEVADLRKRTADTIDADRLATLKKRLPKLRPAECRLIVALYDAAPRTIHRTVVAEIATTFDSTDPDNLMRCTVCRANGIVIAAGCPSKPIRVVRGVGYYLDPKAHQWLSRNVYGGIGK